MRILAVRAHGDAFRYDLEWSGLEAGTHDLAKFLVRKAGTALAGVATTGYFGYLAGPPLIGLAARAAGLPAALGIVCGACALVAAGAVIVPPPRITPAR